MWEAFALEELLRVAGGVSYCRSRLELDATGWYTEIKFYNGSIYAIASETMTGKPSNPSVWKWVPSGTKGRFPVPDSK